MTRSADIDIMPKWFDIGPLEHIPKRGARVVKTPRRDIAVFRTASDEVFALENRCPHRGGPLSEGIVHGRKVACPLHNWIIELETGKAAGADEGCVHRFPVKVEKGRVYLEMGVAVAF
jgi:nitrite reductase (NADH) small subunit